MARNFPDWLTAFCAYTDNGFTPPQFNLWTGLSTLAAALERKVWLRVDDRKVIYPNVYVLLIAAPGIGKSTAADRGIELLEELNRDGGSISFLPSQMTEAKFVDLVSASKPFHIGNTAHFQSANYFYASEASASVRNIFGDFIAMLTDFYDCPNRRERATMSGGRVQLNNLCINMLACSTFDYLGKLITDDNIMGGFASRVIYVAHQEKSIRKVKFGGDVTEAAQKQRNEYRAALIEDLRAIHQMAGPFRGSPAYGAAFEAGSEAFEHERYGFNSERLQSLLVRKRDNVAKVSMLLSAAQSSAQVVTDEHWKVAQAMVTERTKILPEIFRMARTSDVRTQKGVNANIVNYMDKPRSMNDLRVHLSKQGVGALSIETTIKTMIASNQLAEVGGGKYEMLGNPNDYL